MHWIAPSEKDTDNAALEKRLWDAADQFRPKKCEVRSPSCEVRSVRHSTFVLRHCPAPHDATGRFDFVLAKSKSARQGVQAWLNKGCAGVIADQRPNNNLAAKRVLSCRSRSDGLFSDRICS